MFDDFAFEVIHPSRKREIDAVAAGVTEECKDGDRLDFRAFFDDRNITYFEHRDVVIPYSVACCEKADPVSFEIFNYPFSRRSVKRFTLGHELGHILLGHLERDLDEQGLSRTGAEREANYFAKRLTGVWSPLMTVHLMASEIRRNRGNVKDTYARELVERLVDRRDARDALLAYEQKTLSTIVSSCSPVSPVL